MAPGQKEKLRTPVPPPTKRRPASSRATEDPLVAAQMRALSILLAVAALCMLLWRYQGH